MASQSESPFTFDKFALLPIEIQNKIWGYTLKSRSITINYHWSMTDPTSLLLGHVYPPSANSSRAQGRPDISHRLPAALFVNYKSRQALLPSYPSTLHGGAFLWETPTMAHYIRGRNNHYASKDGYRVNPNLDVLHLDHVENKRAVLEHANLLLSIGRSADMLHLTGLHFLSVSLIVWRNDSLCKHFNRSFANFVNLEKLDIFYDCHDCIHCRPEYTAAAKVKYFGTDLSKDVIRQQVEAQLSEIKSDFPRWKVPAVKVAYKEGIFEFA